jgi:TIR domain
MPVIIWVRASLTIEPSPNPGLFRLYFFVAAAFRTNTLTICPHYSMKRFSSARASSVTPPRTKNSRTGFMLTCKARACVVGSLHRTSGGGKKLHQQIDEAIRLYDRLLLILSKASMSSEWVKTEIATARKRESREHRRMLFPVALVSFDTVRDWECFDADAGKDSAREIREYFIPDFSDWKNHDRYQKAFKRLLKDLKAGDEVPIRDNPTSRT